MKLIKIGTDIPIDAPPVEKSNVIDLTPTAQDDNSVIDLTGTPQKDNTLIETATGVLDIDPDKFAKAKQYGRTLEEDPNFIYNNMSTYEQALKNPDPDYLTSFHKQHPKTASWLNKNQSNMALTKDSLEDLGVMDFIIGGIKRDLPNAIARSVFRKPTPRDIDSLKEVASNAYDYAGDLVQEFKDTTVKEQIGKFKTGFLKGYSQAQRTESIVNEMHNTLITGEVTPGFLEEYQAFQASQPENPGGLSPAFNTGEQIVNMGMVLRKASLRSAQVGMASIFAPDAAPAFFAVGAKAGAFEGSYELEASNAFPEYLALKDRDGNPVNPRLAATYAMATGLINAGFEMANLSIILKTLPGGTRLLNAVTKNPKIFNAATKAGAVRHAIKMMLTGVISENVTEQLQNVAAIGVEKAVTGEFPDIERVLEESKQTALAVTGSMLTLGGMGAVTNTVSQVRQVNKANKVKEDLVNISKAITKLKERDAETAKDYVEDIAKESDAENIYIPVKNFKKYWQTKDIDPTDAAKELGVENEYNIATEEDGVVKIPLSTVTDKMVGTEHYNGLIDDMKFDPNDYTVNEAKEVEQNTTAELEAEIESSKTAAVEESRASGEFAQVQKFYIDQLQNAFVAEGKKESQRNSIIEKWATIAASHDITEASRRGLSLVEYYKETGKLRISGDLYANTITSLKNFAGISEKDLADYNVSPEDMATLKAKFPKLIKKEKAEEKPETYRKKLKGALSVKKDSEIYARLKEASLLGMIAKEGGTPVDVAAEQMLNNGDLIASGDISPEEQLLNAIIDDSPVFNQVAASEKVETGKIDDIAKSLNITGDQLINRLLGREEEFVRDENGEILFQDGKPTEAFKNWFGDSKVVDENGDPLVVYHGTTHDFEIFNRDKIGIENDFGQGFYFTNDYNDVETNYAGEGPDLTNRIDRLAERIRDDEELSYEDAVERARERLIGGEGKSLPVYLSIKNPINIGGAEETWLDYTFDEETEEEGGSLLDFVEALRTVASGFYDANINTTIGEVLENVEIKATDLIDILKKSEGLIYATDKNGDLASNEIIRLAFENIGFDGIIDYTVYDKFGYGRKIGQPMENMDYDTVHYIVFEPTQIKSVQNKGTFDPNNPNIFYQTNPYGPEFNINLRSDQGAGRSSLIKGSELVRGEDIEPEVKDRISGNPYYSLARVSVAELKDKRVKTKDKRVDYGRLIVDLTGEVLSGYNKVVEAFNSGLDAITVFKAINKDALFQDRNVAPPMYSAVERSVQAITQEKATPDQWLGMIKKFTGVKEEEILWLGLDEFLSGKKTVTKQELLDHIQANKVQIKEVVHGATVSEQEIAQVQQAAKAKGYTFEVDPMAAGEGLILDKDGNVADYDELPGDVRALADKFGVLLEGQPEPISFEGWSEDEIKQHYDDTFGTSAPEHMSIDEIKNAITEAEFDVPLPSETKFASYTLPGGKNYKELLVTMPKGKGYFEYNEDNVELIDPVTDEKLWFFKVPGGQVFQIAKKQHPTIEEAKKYIIDKKTPAPYEKGQFNNSHFTEPNILYHVRFNERTEAEGKKVLFIEEIQSDWHQKGREKGYKGTVAKVFFKDDKYSIETKDGSWVGSFNTEEEAKKSRLWEQLNSGAVVPDAPLKKSWQESAFRRMVSWAAENGFDKVAWTTGEQQADRYSLFTVIDKITWNSNIGDATSVTLNGLKGISGQDTELLVSKSTGEIRVTDAGAPMHWTGSKLSDVVGKDVANKILTEKNGTIDKSSKIGGEGMKGFYDNILVSYANKFAKKFNSKVEKTKIDGIATNQEVMDINFEASNKLTEELIKAGVPENELSYIRQSWEHGGREKAIKYSSKAVNEYEETRLNIDKVEVHSITITPSMREVALSEGFPLFQEKQGAIEFDELGAAMTLYASADASTFIHEFAHKILKDMGNWIKSGKADQQYMKDFAIISSYLLDNVTLKEKKKIALDRMEKSYDALSEEERNTVDDIADQELFARTFEKYLRDGKAPTEELRSVFSTFKRLLTSIYKVFTTGVADIEISDDVRNVFDRMLATDEQIEASRLRKGELDTSKMTPEMRDKVESLRAEAKDQAYGLLMAQQMEELTAKHKAFVDGERKAKTEEVTNAINQDNFYAVSDLVAKNLNNPDVKELANKMLDNTLPDKDRLNFDTMAQLNGYEDGFKLASQIANSNTKAEEIAFQVEDYMAQFADLKDSEVFKDEVERTVHNEMQEELLSLENQIIKGMINKDRNDNLRAKLARARNEAKMARETARNVLSRKSAKEASTFLTFFNAERDAAKKVGEFLAKGNLDKAAEYKYKQLLNHALARESIKVRKRYEKALKYLKKIYSKDKKLFKKDEHFIQVASLLSRAGLLRLDYMIDSKEETLKEWDTRFETILGTNLISDWLFDESAKLDLKKLPMDRIEDLTDALKNIQTIANQEANFVWLMKKKNIADHITEMDLAAEKSVSSKTRAKNKATVEKTLGQTITALPKLYLISSTKIQEMCRKLQGGDFGIWSETLVDAVNNAQDFKSQKLEEVTKEYTDLFEKHYPDKSKRFAMNYDQKFYKEFGTVMSKMRLMAMAMNMGAEKNRNLLFGVRPIGFDPNLVYNQKVVEDVLFKNLDKNDWMFVQEAWKMIDRLWPEGAKMVKELTGFEPKKIKTVPFTVRLANGEKVEMSGGYYPLKADPRSSDKQQTLEQLNNSMIKIPKSISMIMTKTGRFKERTQASYPLMLDLGLIDRHIKDSVNDLAFRPVLIDLKRLIADPRMKNILDLNLGIGGYDQFKQWLDDIAGAPVSSRITSEMAVQAAEAVRHNTTIALLAYKLSVLAQNAANIFLYGDAVDGYGYKDALKGIYKMVFNYIPNMMFNTNKYKAMIEFIDSKSRMMKDREDSPDFTLKKAFADYFGKHDAVISAIYNKSKLAGETVVNFTEYKQEVVEFATHLMSFTDNISARPQWLNAYEKQISLGKTEEEAKIFANRLIDQVIGSGRRLDTAGFFRGSTLARLMTMFKSFMNTLFNQWLRQIGGATSRQGHILKIAKDPRFLAFVATRGIAFPLASAILAGRYFKEDDDDDVLSWAGQSIMRDTSALMVGVGDITSVLADNFLGNYSYGYRPSPVISAVEAIAIDPFKEMNAYINDEASIQDVLEKQAKAAAFMFGYPDALNQHFFNAVDYIDGTMTPEYQDLYRRRRESER